MPFVSNSATVKLTRMQDSARDGSPLGQLLLDNSDLCDQIMTGMAITLFTEMLAAWRKMESTRRKRNKMKIAKLTRFVLRA